MAANTYTDEGGALQTRINDLTSQVTSSINAAPQMRQQLGQAIQNTPTAYQPESQERGDLVQKLFEHDKVLAGRYSDPTGSMYIEDPAARDRATYAPEAPVLGAISTRNSNLALLRSLFGDAISRGMDLYSASIQSKQQELDGLMKQLDRLDQQKAAAEDKRRWEAQFARSGSGGGSGGVEYSQVPVKTANGVEMQWAKIDRKSGNIIEVLGKQVDPMEAFLNRQKSPVASYEKQKPSLTVLRDPKSGDVYSYEGTTDPDYIEDLGKGYLPQ